MTHVSTAITIGAVVVIAGGITMGLEEAFTLVWVLVIGGIGLAVLRGKVMR